MTDVLLAPPMPAEDAEPGLDPNSPAANDPSREEPGVHRLLACTSPELPLADRLRSGIAAGVHLGVLRAGSRLPSVRALAGAAGVDHRLAAASYRALEGLGVVEVRGRQGAFVAEPPGGDVALIGETAAWARDVLVRAAQLRIKAAHVPALLQRAVATPLRCLCLESVEDEMEVLLQEYGGQWGMDVTPLYLRSGGTPAALAAAAREADLVVSTPFVAAEAARSARAAGRPLVVSTASLSFTESLRVALDAGGLTVLVVDPAYADRLRVLPGAEQLDVRRADDPCALESLPADCRVLLTPAARKRLGSQPLRTLVAAGEFASTDAAYTVATLMAARGL